MQKTVAWFLLHWPAKEQVCCADLPFIIFLLHVYGQKCHKMDMLISLMLSSSQAWRGFRSTRMTESPRRNILEIYRSLLTGLDFFLPFPVFGTSVHISFTFSMTILQCLKQHHTSPSCHVCETYRHSYCTCTMQSNIASLLACYEFIGMARILCGGCTFFL